MLALPTVVQGGNPALKPTTARSWSAGLTLAPEGKEEGLRFAARYWSAAISDRVVGIDEPWTRLLEHEDSFPDRVHRAAQTAEDIAAGQPGALESVDLTISNGGRLEASGVDLAVSYAIATQVGKLVADLMSTWSNTFRPRDHAGLEPEERVAVASVQGSFPRWRAIASLTWERQGSI